MAASGSKAPGDRRASPRDARPSEEGLLGRAGNALSAEAAQARATSRQRKEDAERLVAESRELKRRLHPRPDEALFTPQHARASDDGAAHADATTHILIEDPDLAEALVPSERLAATELLRARVIRVKGPSWKPLAMDPHSSYGLLILEGLLARRIRVGRAVATELISSGEILRPWEEPCLADVIPPQIDWRVLSPARLAILDEAVTRAISAWPQLMVAFSNRLLLRVRHAEYMMAVGHLPRVEQRLLGSLWHLASNWGTVTPRGVQVPFRLTHELLGEVVGARRPSVTLAVRELYRSGQLARDPAGRFLLVGDPSDWTASAHPARRA